MKPITELLQPEKLWCYFEELSKIPRASKNEEQVLHYIIRFARERDLEFKQDRAGNVVIRKPASPGFEVTPVVVLQSHVDMVCEKNGETTHDFLTDPVTLKIDGEWVRAEGTSLGADNGIGVAAMLALLEDSEVQLGKLEFLFTVDEETGLTGAFHLDPEMIEGRIFLNLDTEEGGTLYIGCAGGKDSDILLPMETDRPDEKSCALKLSVAGLRGGHSGAEIHLGRANGIKLLARILNHLKESFRFSLAAIRGGDKHNAIPREAFAIIVVYRDDARKVEHQFHSYCRSMKEEYSATDPDARFEISQCDLAEKVFDRDSTRMLVNLLMAVPHGVITMSTKLKDLVETSTNLSSVRTEAESVALHASHRSSSESALEWVADLHTSLAEMANACCEQDEGYPTWNPDPGSKLLEQAKKAVYSVIGREARVKAIHAGLECGVIKKNFKDMDALSIGPTIEGAHSPDERVHIESVETFYHIIIETLKNINNETSNVPLP